MTHSTSSRDRYRNRLLAAIALIMALWALKSCYPVAMPLLFAAMILAAVWPIKSWLDRWLPGWLSYTLAILALLAVFAAFAGAIYLSIGQVTTIIGSKLDKLAQVYRSIARHAAAMGLPLNSALDQQRLAAIAQMAVGKLYSFVTYFGFIAILVILGMPEVPHLRARLAEELGRRQQSELVDILTSSAEQVRGYLGTTLMTSAITGIASLLFSLAVGLDLGLVWGLLNFLLNFVPVIGNIVGIVPPVLYAFVQFDGYMMPIIVLVGFALLQMVISNVIYPLLQGRQLSISPVAIIIAMAFWSWMWGIAGALIAVPLTATLTILCRHFERTQWISALISKE